MRSLSDRGRSHSRRSLCTLSDEGVWLTELATPLASSERGVACGIHDVISLFPLTVESSLSLDPCSHHSTVPASAHCDILQQPLLISPELSQAVVEVCHSVQRLVLCYG